MKNVFPTTEVMVNKEIILKLTLQFFCNVLSIIAVIVFC